MSTSSLRLVLALCVTAALLSACNRTESPEALLAAAKTSLAQHNERAAVIQLKNVLQQKPDDAEARFLLGSALLELGDATVAVIELRKAADLKYPQPLLLPVLARALNATGQFSAVVTEFGNTTLTDPLPAADLKTSLSLAYTRLGKPEAAARELAAALALSPDSPAAQLLDARSKAGAGQFDAALARVDALLRTAAAASNADAWALKGQLLTAKNDLDGALAAYRKALEVRKDLPAAHSGVVTVLLQQQKLDAAVAQTAAFKKAWPKHPQVTWFEAQIALQRRDLKEAGKLAQQLLAAAPNNVSFLHFSGLVDSLAGSAVQAENTLSKALQLAPGDEAVRLLLARTELRLGQTAKALTVIEPMVVPASSHAAALGIAAQAHLMEGDLATAQTFFARAAKADPADVSSRAALAIAKLGKGDDAAALGELNALAAADKGTVADLPLIHALMLKKDIDGALAAIARLDKKQPDWPPAKLLRGDAQLARKDTAAARASYDAALQANPSYFPAAARLASLDLQDRKPELAVKRYEQMVAADAKNVRAAVALAELRTSQGAKPADVAEAVGKTVKLNPEEPAPRLWLIENALRRGDANAALLAAQSGVAALPANAPMVDALGRAQAAAGDQNQALATFSKLATMTPQSPLPQLRIADIQVAAKNYGAAKQSLQRALAVAPTSKHAQRNLVSLELLAGRPADAVNVARAAQKQRPSEGFGHALEGDVERSRKNPQAAVAAYRAAYAKEKSSEFAIKLHAALNADNKRAEADRLAADRLKQAPSDTAFLSYLGDAATAAKDYAAAEARYLDVIRLAPNQGPAHNNVAWVMTAQRKKGAVAYAEAALRLRPNEPQFLDTLASALAFEGDPAKALTIQKSAVDLQPADATLRLHLAQLYLQTGDNANAKTELQQLEKLGDKFANAGMVRQLLKTL